MVHVDMPAGHLPAVRKCPLNRTRCLWGNATNASLRSDKGRFHGSSGMIRTRPMKFCFEWSVHAGTRYVGMIFMSCLRLLCGAVSCRGRPDIPYECVSAKKKKKEIIRLLNVLGKTTDPGMPGRFSTTDRYRVATGGTPCAPICAASFLPTKRCVQPRWFSGHLEQSSTKTHSALVSKVVLLSVRNLSVMIQIQPGHT